MTPEQISAKLAHLVTAFDAAEEKKAAANPRRHHHNIYALGLYLGRVDSVIADMACGMSLHRALYENFQDRLLTYLEKGFALPATYCGGGQDKVRRGEVVL
jgi:hypothetical protein